MEGQHFAALNLLAGLGLHLARNLVGINPEALSSTLDSQGAREPSQRDDPLRRYGLIDGDDDLTFQTPPCGELPVLDEGQRPVGVLNLKHAARTGIF